MIPVEKMRITDLIQKTTDEIPSPYDSMQFAVSNIRPDDDPQQYFYDFNTANDQHQRKRGFQNKRDFQQKRLRLPETDPGTQRI